MHQRIFALVLALNLSNPPASAQHRTMWNLIPNRAAPILWTSSQDLVASPFASNGKERPTLTIFCGVASAPVVEFKGHFQLLATDAASIQESWVVIDGETLPVHWELDRDRESMTATRSDIQGLAFRMRHGKEMMLGFQTAGGPQQSVTFSLAGLDALMTKASCR